MTARAQQAAWPRPSVRPPPGTCAPRPGCRLGQRAQTHSGVHPDGRAARVPGAPVRDAAVPGGLSCCTEARAQHKAGLGEGRGGSRAHPAAPQLCTGTVRAFLSVQWVLGRVASELAVRTETLHWDSGSHTVPARRGHATPGHATPGHSGCHNGVPPAASGGSRGAANICTSGGRLRIQAPRRGDPAGGCQVTGTYRPSHHAPTTGQTPVSPHSKQNSQ